jgi:hypothetical protein
MSESTSAFLIGLFTGIIVTGFFSMLSVGTLKKEAIKRGYAEMKLATPYDTKSVFTWKDGAK